MWTIACGVYLQGLALFWLLGVAVIRWQTGSWQLWWVKDYLEEGWYT